MSEQLELGLYRTPARTKRAKKAKPEKCKCGHLAEEHNNGTGRCTPCKDVVVRLSAEMGPLAKGHAKLCTRFRSKSRKPPTIPLELAGPLGSFPIWRPDTVFPKPMGWGAIEETPIVHAGEDIADPFVRHQTRWTVYLSQMKCESKNHVHIPNDPVVARRVMLGKKFRMSQNGEWAKAALEQLAAREGIETSEHEPLEIILTLITFGNPDQDNRDASLAFVRDGVCEALGIDDAYTMKRTTPANGFRAPAGYTWIRYEHGHSFKQGVRGVRIEVVWA